MRKFLFLLTTALTLLGVVSCKSEEEKAIDKAKETIITQVFKSKQLRTTGTTQDLQLPMVYGSSIVVDTVMAEDINITREGERYMATLPQDIKVIMEKSGEDFKIIDSYNFISRGDFPTSTLAKKTGRILGNESDVEWSTAINDLNNNLSEGSFMRFLMKKYPSAKIGNLKTIDIKKKVVGSFYRVDVTYESGGYYDVTLNVRVKDRQGVQRSSQRKTRAAIPAGERESVMFLFKTAAIGNVGSVDVDYFITDWDITTLLVKYAPLSQSDYQEYLSISKGQ